MRSFSQFFANILVKGNNNKKPATSVINPGVIKTSPAMAISNASSNYSPGILPSRMVSWIRNKVRNPSILAR